MKNPLKTYKQRLSELRIAFLLAEMDANTPLMSSLQRDLDRAKGALRLEAARLGIEVKV